MNKKRHSSQRGNQKGGGILRVSQIEDQKRIEKNMKRKLEEPNHWYKNWKDTKKENMERKEKKKEGDSLEISTTEMFKDKEDREAI